MRVILLGFLFFIIISLLRLIELPYKILMGLIIFLSYIFYFRPDFLSQIIELSNAIDYYLPSNVVDRYFYRVIYK